MTDHADAIATLTDADPGDRLRIDTPSHDWREGLDVLSIEIHDWVVPFGEDWQQHSLDVEGGGGGRYRIVVDDTEQTATLWRTDDDDTLKKIHGYVQAAEPLGEPVCEECGRTFESRRGLSVHQAKAHGDGADDGDDESEPMTTCPDCGREFETPRQLSGHLNIPWTDCERDASSPDEVSGDLDADAVHAAIDELSTLDEIADELDVSPGEARKACVQLDRYDEVRELSRYRGGIET